MKGAKSKADTAKVTKKAEAKVAPKRKAAEKPSKAAKPAKKGKKASVDPNKPKRPASAFFVFMEEFRKEFKEKNPNNKAVSAVSKAGGDKWKSLSDADKAPYQAKANKRKTEYAKNLDAYNKKQKSAPAAAEEDEEESDKSKSEVNDEEEDDEEGSGDDGDEDEDDE